MREGNWGGGDKEEGAETFSKDSPRLSPSSVPVPVQSPSIGNACSAPAPQTGAESSPSDGKVTEWKGGTEEAVTCPLVRCVPSVEERLVSVSRAGRVLGA